jgi:hypothetical protein
MYQRRDKVKINAMSRDPKSSDAGVKVSLISLKIETGEFSRITSSFR